MTDATQQIEATPREKVEAVCKELGLTMTAEFVPFSKSRNALPRNFKDGKPWRSLNWKVTLRRLAAHDSAACYPADKPGREILTTDYSAGEAHCPAYKASIKALGNRDSIMRDKAIAYECETGRNADYSVPRAEIKPPPLADVIYSLVSDADVLDCGTFEEWADNLGYNPDSRKDEATYRACLEIALKLRNGIGETGLARLREACQDY